MTKFIEITGENGLPILINADTIKAVAQTADKKRTIIETYERTLCVPIEKYNKIRQALTEDPHDRIASNLLRIWELLRARLH